MSQETVRCPYCVLGSEFRPMFRHAKKSFICLSCGHSAKPDDPYAKCPCPRCRQNRVASQRRSEELRQRPSAEPSRL